MAIARSLVVLVLVLAPRLAGAVPSGCTLTYYGTYSLGSRNAASLADRARELQALGGNFVMATGKSSSPLAALPPGMHAAPGCTLMAAEDWKSRGQWNEAAAREHLRQLAAQFDNDDRVWGICLSHEVDEFADHARRVWMYRLAKSVFRRKPVFFYYAATPADYGADGEVEGDVFFVALPPYTREGDYDRDKLIEKLDRALAASDRTPGIPFWAQTSINADQAYVKGPETMIRTWGVGGARMIAHANTICSRRSPHGKRISAFFWRSLGRFEWDLGYPAFTEQRQRVQEIARLWACGAAVSGR